MHSNEIGNKLLKPKASSLEDKSLARINKRKRHTKKS